MLKTERTDVYNFENAMRGARNPMNSWAKSDSHYAPDGRYVLGENDLALLGKLRRAGSDHRKCLRQVLLSVDITAPLYWWKEYDTYKIGTTANSTSTMHKIHAKPFVMDDFSYDQLSEAARAQLQGTIDFLQARREVFVATKDKAAWWDIIQLLPSSYNQMRTCTMSYENLINMYAARMGHKLDEWRTFCAWVQTLPYAQELICTR